LKFRLLQHRFHIPSGYQYYPEKLRRIKFFDSQNNRRLVFLTNNFRLPAITIANLFKQRWQIELFFKWIKQNLKIKSFYGNSPNAVKTQICIAISVYVLLAIIKKKLKLEHSLYTFLQLVSVSIFEKTPIISMFSDSNYINEIQPDYNQLSLFNL
jgi:IS4 transposase